MSYEDEVKQKGVEEYLFKQKQALSDKMRALGKKKSAKKRKSSRKNIAKARAARGNSAPQK